LLLPEEEKTSANENKLFRSLMSDFAQISKKGDDMDEDNYVVINVSPSVVPTYLPSFRIYAYNITRAGSPETTKEREHRHRRGMHRDLDTGCEKGRHKDSWRCKLKEPWHSDPESPSRRDTLWSPLGYAQVHRRKRAEAV
jgi:endopolyphosphatase